MTLAPGNGLSAQARLGRVLGVPLAALALLAVAPAAVQAATIAAADSAPDSNDSTTDVDAVCSIREAVMALNQGGLNAPTVLTDCTNSSANPFGTSDRVSLAPGGFFE